jgi:hypothetical protein
VGEYGVDPTISGFTPASGEFHMGWPTYGSDLSYTIHISTDEDRGFSQFDDAVNDASGEGTFVTVTGLNPGTTYYVYLEGTDSDGVVHRGPTTYVQTTTY